MSLLNGVSVGLLLFMLSAGLTLIFSMLGAYVGQTLAAYGGFWLAFVATSLIVGAGGALFERTLLRRVHVRGALAELLLTFGRPS